MIYWDNAATTGQKPASVIRAVDTALHRYCANPGRSGHRLSTETAAMVYNAREKAAKFFGASGPECVTFTAGCTESLNVVIKGVLQQGDHVIVSDLEHNAVIRPLIKSGIRYDTAEVSLLDDNETVENFRRRIRPNTRMILCTGASNVIGRRLPLSRLGMLCREEGLLFAVDAAQVAGVFPIDVKAMNIDYLCVAPHKGLYAPMGVGLLIAEKPIPNTLIEGGTGTDSESPYQPKDMPERLESGTVAVPAIAGLSAGLDFVAGRTPEEIYRHELRLTGRVYQALRDDSRYVLYTPDPVLYGYAPVLSFNRVGLSSEETAAYLDRQGIAVRAGLHCAPSAHRRIGTLGTGTVRLAPSAFTTEGETDSLIRVLKRTKWDAKK